MRIFKRLLVTLMLCVALIAGGGCVQIPNRIDTNPHVMDETYDGRIMIVGGVDVHDFQTFYNQTVGGHKEYTVIIDTRGGDAHSTIGIINRILELKREGVKFTTITYNRASSAGFFTCPAGVSRISICRL